MSANPVLERLKALEARHHGLSAEIVVADATSPESPLHESFLWDDAEAAHAHRLSQARKLIRRWTYSAVAPSGERVETPVFTRYQTDYRRTTEVVTNSNAVALIADTVLQQVASVLARNKLILQTHAQLHPASRHLAQAVEALESVKRDVDDEEVA